MRFTTEIKIPKQSFSISYYSKIFSLGSCFAVNMHEKLDYFKFQSTCNPFGILFHPLAIENLLSFAASNKVFTGEDIFFHDERWHSFHAHSQLSNMDAGEFIANLNLGIKAVKESVKESSVIIITYGTSWVYRHTKQNLVVANCHKLPQQHFEKELLSSDDIKQSINRTAGYISSLNPNCKIIFTVSPVRHLKDGFAENQLSKANLFAAIHSVVKSLNNTSYFPSYEIMMDDLRDYRFYAEDMVHPNQLAINYIWEKFVDAMIDESEHHNMKRVDSVQKRLQHRPFNKTSKSFSSFESDLNNRIKAITDDYSFMKF